MLAKPMTRTVLDDEFANDMVVAEAVSPTNRLRGWLLVGLLLCCLAPRVWMAWRLDTLCNDAVFYIQLAESYERGDLEAGLGQLRLNTFPPVLAWLHSAGLDWQTAGEIWGVALSSLTVLPLFGWLRRQFSERLAVVGCLLYAVHPKLVESSPELIRDPTFWLLWTLSLYLTWRAAAEVRLRWYLLSGLCIALALHTRFEGWTLYLPLIGWSVCRQVARARAERRDYQRMVRAAAGCAAAVALCPLLLLAINLTWLANQPRWEWGNFKRLEYVVLWSQATWAAIHGERRRTDEQTPGPAPGAEQPTAATALAAPPPTSLEASPRMSLARTLWMFVNALRRGFGALFGLGWILGFACCPRLWIRRDHLVLFVVAGCIGAGAWIHLWYAQATSSRYFLCIVLLASPCAAMGCCRAYRWLERAANRLLAASQLVRSTNTVVRREPWQNASPRAIALATLALLTLTANATELLAGQHPGRRREAALGRWILNEFGPDQQISTPKPLGLVGFYAQANTRALALEPAAMDGADLAVALPYVAKPHEIRKFTELARRRGLKPVDHRRLPSGYDWGGVVVLARVKTTGS